MCHSLRLTDRPAAINSASYSGKHSPESNAPYTRMYTDVSNTAGNGHYLACACADRATYIVKMPPSSGKSQAFVGML